MDGLHLPVDGLVVPLRRHDFGREVVWRSAQRPCDVGHLFGKAEVGDLEMAVAVEEQIFRLQVPVDDIVRVQIVEGERDFRRVELCDRIRKALPESVRRSCRALSHLPGICAAD